MAVKEFELFHGAVLTKLLRSKRPTNLCMVETAPGEAWSTYTVNNEVRLLVKHSTNQRKLERQSGGLSWTFGFSLEDLRKLQPGSDGKKVFAVLVCGGKDVKRDVMQVCFLLEEEIPRALDIHSPKPCSLTIRYSPGKELCVLRDRRVALRVPQGRLERWVIPGS